MLSHDYVGACSTLGFHPEYQAGYYDVRVLPINYFQLQDGAQLLNLAVGVGRDVEHVTPFQIPWWIEEQE